MPARLAVEMHDADQMHDDPRDLRRVYPVLVLAPPVPAGAVVPACTLTLDPPICDRDVALERLIVTPTR